MRLSFLNNVAIYLFSALILSACSDKVTNLAIDRLNLRDGVLDIPILPGSKITNNCGSIGEKIGKDSKIGVDFNCIEFPMASEGVDGKDWDSDYTRELDRDGWKWAGGEANAYYFEKPLDENCNHDLTMLGWLQATEEQEKNYGDTGGFEGIENLVFIFAISDELKCGTERRATG